MAKDKPLWQRREDESAQAYAAFCAYYLLAPDERSIDSAWRAGAKQGQNRDGKRAPKHWGEWSSRFKWVKRAAAHDKHLAELDRQRWVERRRQLRESEWQDAEQIRRMVMDALPEASRFIQRKEVFTKGKDGDPDQLVITESFNIVGLMQTRSGADKLQRLATDEPTEHVQLTGSALDAYVAGQLARLANGGEAGVGDGFEPDEAETDGETESNDPDL